MSDALLLALAFAATVVGFAWLASSMDAHWHQVRGERAVRPGAARTLRVVGSAALVASFGLCLAADHASMAVLVWVMLLAVAAPVVALIFTYRPRFFVPLVAWL